MFIWKEEFDLGIEKIDNEHKKLFEIGNRVNELTKSFYEGDDNFDQIVVVINELSDYAVYHFKNEEVLMEKHNYPNLEEHREEHEKFVFELNEIDFEKIDDNQEEFLKKLLEKIVGWIFNHILKEDHKYKNHIKENL